MKKSIIAAAITAAFTATGATAATLPVGAQLTIDSGSNFVMGAGVFGPGVSLFGENGITVGPGTGDTGTGSHGGVPAASDVGAATQPWNFFFNTGYDYVSTTNGSGSFGGDTTNGVDMTAWTVTWNGIASIPMGGCGLVAGGCTQGSTVFNDTGIGAFTWDGTDGGAYTITYTAHVPVGDPSNFGGVQYDLFLTGTVNTPAVPVPAAVWLFGSGLLGLVGVARRRKS